MLVSGAILGFIAGFALRRDWRPLRELQLRAFPVLLAAILMRGVALAVPRVGLPLEVLGIAAIGLVALINRRTTGMVLIAVGCALNVLVIVDRKSTRLNSSHSQISYAVFCLKKKTTTVSQMSAFLRVSIS